MTGSVGMRLLNMAILGRAEPPPNFPGPSHAQSLSSSTEFQFPPIFPKPSQASDHDVDREVEFPDVFDGQQSFNSVYFVNDRRYDFDYNVDGIYGLKLNNLWECVSRCYEIPECSFFSAIVKSFGPEHNDELDEIPESMDNIPVRFTDSNCVMLNEHFKKPMTENRRRWVSGHMPARNGAKALSKGIENWTESYPDNIGNYDHQIQWPQNKTGKFIYLSNFKSAWSFGARHKVGGFYFDENLIGLKDLGECFDACLRSPLKCNAISHGLKGTDAHNKCLLVYVYPSLNETDGEPLFEDLDVSAHHSKNDRISWRQTLNSLFNDGRMYNTWRIVPRSDDFPFYTNSIESTVSPWEEYRPDIVPASWTDRNIYVLSANQRLLPDNIIETQDASTFELCGKQCAEKWSTDNNDDVDCRAFSFNNRAKLCELSPSLHVDSGDHSGDWISVKMQGGPSTTTTTTTTTTTKEMRNFGKNCLEDGIIWDGQCSGDYQTGWNDNASNADVDAANQLLGCRQEAWTDVKPLCLRHGSVCPKECAGYDESLGAFIKLSYEDWMELGRKDGMVYPEEL